MEPTTPLNTKPRKSRLFVYFITLIVDVLMFTSGASAAWITAIIPKINTPESPFKHELTATQISILAGLTPAGGIAGPIFAGKLADKIGRKKTLLLLGNLLLISYLIPIISNNLLLHYLSRLLAGTGVGCAFNVVPLYIAEISEARNRGALGCSINFFFACGINFSFGVGSYTSLTLFSIISFLPLIFFLPVFYLLAPESPTFLAFKQNQEALKTSLIKLKKFNDSIDLQTDVTKLLSSSESTNKGGRFKELGKYKKALIISLTIIIVQQAGGYGAIITYIRTIFESVHVSWTPEFCTLIVGCSQVCGPILSTLLIDRLGRKVLLFLSCISTALSQFSLGLYFLIEPEHFSWVPITSLIVFLVTFGIGLGPVPWVLIPEIFPANVRSSAASLTSIICFITTVLITTTFLSLKLSIHLSNCFFLYGIFPVIGTFFIYFYLPETKGKSFDQIQELLL